MCAKMLQTPCESQWNEAIFVRKWLPCCFHTGDFPRGVGHRVENGRGLTKVAVVLLNGLIW